MVGNLALLRYFAVHQGVPGMNSSGVRMLLGLALGNLLLLLVFELLGSRLLRHAGRSLPRLALFAMLAAVSLGACIGWWYAPYRGFLVALGLVYMTVLPCYLQLRRDLLILALLAYALVGVASFGLARWLIGNLDDFVLLNLLGLFVLGASALATLWLHQVHRGQQA